MVYSASYVHSMERFGNGYAVIQKHIAYLLIGSVFFLVASRIPMEWLAQYSRIIFIGVLVSLILVLIPGVGLRSGGARRWVALAGFTFQPAELLKCLYPFFFACWHNLLKDLYGEEVIGNFKDGFLKILGLPVLLSVFLILQPDYGTTAILWATTFVLLFLARYQLRYILGSIFIFGMSSYGLIVTSPYRMKRLLTYLDPWKDPLNSGFQIIQSMTAFHSGGFFGKGLGNSQAKLYYLPAAQNDFIFSIVGEEVGWIGVILICVLFFGLIYQGFRSAFRAKTEIGQLYGFGFSSLLGVQALINMSVSLGIVPNKGLTLPFVSYGGSSLVSLLAGAGFIYSLGFESERIESTHHVPKIKLKTKSVRSRKPVSVQSFKKVNRPIKRKSKSLTRSRKR